MENLLLLDVSDKGTHVFPIIHTYIWSFHCNFRFSVLSILVRRVNYPIVDGKYVINEHLSIDVETYDEIRRRPYAKKKFIQAWLHWALLVRQGVGSPGIKSKKSPEGCPRKMCFDATKNWPHLQWVSKYIFTAYDQYTVTSIITFIFLYPFSYRYGVHLVVGGKRYRHDWEKERCGAQSPSHLLESCPQWKTRKGLSRAGTPWKTHWGCCRGK